MDLIKRLESYEYPLAKREGSPGLAGKYAGLSADYTSPDDFVGLGEKDYGENDDKVGILECTCGEAGCWSFAAKIKVTDDTVIWSDFELPYENVDSPEELWDYSNFGPFVFSRCEFENELTKLKEFALPLSTEY